MSIDSCSEPDVSSAVPEDLASTPAARARAEVLSPVPPAGYPRKSGDPILLIPARTLKGAVNAMPLAPSLIHSALGNFAFAMSLISLVISIICFAVTWLTVLRDARSIKDQVLPNVTGVSILGHPLRLDLDAYVLSISWKIVFCGARAAPVVSSRSYAHVPANCKPLDRALDVYLNDPSIPVLSFISYGEPISTSVLDLPKFTMNHQFDKHGKWDPTQDLMVPFEHYSFHASAFAIDPITNNSVEIVMFGIADTFGDFVIRSYDAADTTKFAHESEDGFVTTEVESRTLRVEIERSAIAKAFVVCLFLGNWAATVSSVYTTALVVVGRLEANSMIAALPFSALVVIPTIRSLYACSPPLGFSIDAVAFLVQIATTGLCSLVLLRVLTTCGRSNRMGSPVEAPSPQHPPSSNQALPASELEAGLQHTPV